VTDATGDEASNSARTHSDQKRDGDSSELVGSSLLLASGMDVQENQRELGFAAKVVVSAGGADSTDDASIDSWDSV
jgi:hypothetical protein